MDILQIIIAIIILWLLYEIVKELRGIRTSLELPSNAKGSYDEKLNALDEKIHMAETLVAISEKKDERAYRKELAKLVKEREEILDHRRNHFK
jgi:hypothetical protein